MSWSNEPAWQSRIRLGGSQALGAGMRAGITCM